jgi:hypothetical protein
MEIPNSRLQIRNKFLTGTGHAPLGFGICRSSRRLKKQFALPAAAAIFRASCPSLSLAVKPEKLSRNGSKLPLVAKFCVLNLLGGI